MDLGQLTWHGKPFEWVRRRTNYCRRHNLITTERRPEQLAADEWTTLRAEVRQVAAESLSTKPQAAQMRFFEGSIDEMDLGKRRLFVARGNNGAGRIEGRVICNPILAGRKWSSERYRHRPDAVRGTMAFLFHHVFQQLQEECVEPVPMCLNIGRNIDTPTPRDSFLIGRGQSLLRRFTGLIFDFSAILHFKSRFRPRYKNRYVCTSPNTTIGSLIVSLHVSGAYRLNLWNLACSVVNRIRKRSTRKSLWEDGERAKSSTG